MLLQPVSSVGSIRVREAFIQAPNNSLQVFTSPVKFQTAVGTEEWVYHNGHLLLRGGLNDYTISESGGVGTGFDTITFNFIPHVNDNLALLIYPSA